MRLTISDPVMANCDEVGRENGRGGGGGRQDEMREKKFSSILKDEQVNIYLYGHNVTHYILNTVQSVTGRPEK